MSSGSTPRKVRASASAAYSEGGLEDAREAVLREKQNVPQIPVLELANAVLAKSVNTPAFEERPNHIHSSALPIESIAPTFSPTVTDDMVNHVMDKLRDDGTLTDEGWRGFEKAKKARETAYFRPLEPLFDAIVNASEFAGSSLLRFKVTGTKTPGSDQRHSSAQPDAYMILKTSSIPESDRAYNNDTEPYDDNTDDLVVFFEFKKRQRKPDVYDNTSKVIWNMHHCMRDDARRRFVYGATIEDNFFRLLYHDRSAFVSSEYFDWTEEHDMLVRIVLGFAACTTMEQLGFDSTIRRIGKPQGYSGKVYEIDVHGEEKTMTFVTRRVIANFGPDAVCGRGTRVWAVIEKPSAGVDPHPEHLPEFALKDCWIDADRAREGDVLQSILTNDDSDPILTDAMQNMQLDEEELHEINDGRQHFLGVVLHGDVPLTYVVLRGDVPTTYQCGDQTHFIHRGGVTMSHLESESTKKPIIPMKPPSKKRTNFFMIPLAPPSLHSVGGVPEPKMVIRPRGGDVRRNMQHYRIVFDEIVTSLYDLTTFRDIFQCLLGAIQGIQYLYERKCVHRDISSGNVLFRKADGDGPGRGVLIDLEYAKHLVHNSVTHEAITGTRQFMSVEVLNQEFVYGDEPPDDVVPPIWRHLPLHDLESVWWLLVWLNFRLGCEGATSVPGDRRKFDSLFGENPEYRMTVCVTPSYLRRLVPSFLASSALWPIVIGWREKLTDLMRTIEDTFKEPTDTHYAEAFSGAISCMHNLLSLDNKFLDAELQEMAL